MSEENKQQLKGVKKIIVKQKIINTINLIKIKIMF